MYDILLKTLLAHVYNYLKLKKKKRIYISTALIQAFFQVDLK